MGALLATHEGDAVCRNPQISRVAQLDDTAVQYSRLAQQAVSHSTAGTVG